MSVSLGSLLELSIPSTFVPQDVPEDEELTMASDLEPITGNNKIQRCVITCFPPDADPKWLLPNTYFTDTSMIENWCGQFEICPDTDKLHFHIYVHFVNSKKPRFNTLRDVFRSKFTSTVNIAKSKHRASNHGQACSVNYVLAPNKRAPDTEPMIWEHNKKKLAFDEKLWNERTTKSKSKEDKNQEIVDYIESKPKHWDWNSILHETYESKVLLAACSWGSKYHAGRHAEAPRREIANVIILYGAGGTGKSTLARSWDTRADECLEERYYLRNYDDGHFWGSGKTSYRSQRIIHLEEFCGQESATKFKQICDIGAPGPNVNVKNSSAQLNHESIIITSNTHPAGWYHHMCDKDPKQWNPLARRFTQVWFFPEYRPDGELNIPCKADGIEPYYIDQTADFQEHVRDWQAILGHAAEHWPLKEPDDYDANTSTVYAPGFNDPKRRRLN